jgi:hypothetical protein
MTVQKEFIGWAKSEGLPPNRARQAWEVLRDAVWENFDFDKGFSGTDESIRSLLRKNFSAGKIDKSVSFALRLQDGEQSEWAIKQAVESITYELERSASWEYSGDSLDVSAVRCYAIVRDGWIEVIATESGQGERLPKEGRKYIGDKGDMRWSFPVSSQAIMKSRVDFMIDEKGSQI